MMEEVGQCDSCQAEVARLEVEVVEHVKKEKEEVEEI